MSEVWMLLIKYEGWWCIGEGGKSQGEEGYGGVGGEGGETNVKPWN